MAPKAGGSRNYNTIAPLKHMEATMTQGIGLVPLDGSATAECILPWSAALARSLNLRLVLLHLLPNLGNGHDLTAQPEARVAKHYLDGVAASLREEGVDVDVRVAGCQGDIDAGINAIAAELNATLILIGSNGRSGFKRAVLGSVADGVLRSAACPALVVQANPATVPEQPCVVRRVLVPLDGSARAEAALPHALLVAAGCNAVLDIVHVAPWGWMLAVANWPDLLPEALDEALESRAETYLREVRARLPHTAVIEGHVLRGDPAEMILEHARHQAVDLIVMTTHGRSGIARWALGSVADRIVRSSDIPVLMLRSELAAHLAPTAYAAAEPAP